jgi:phytoene dehydrogenase-like protein
MIKPVMNALWPPPARFSKKASSSWPTSLSSVTDMLRVAPDLIKLQSYKSVYKRISQFVKDDFLRQIFSFHPLLVGGNPFDTSSIYAMIHYLEREWGVYYAMGGTGAIVAGLIQACLRSWVEKCIPTPSRRDRHEGRARHWHPLARRQRA